MSERLFVRVWAAAILGLLLAILFASSAEAQGPQLTVDEPSQGQTLSSGSVDVRFEVTGLTIVPSDVPLAEAGKHPEVNRAGQGHVHFMLDLQPLVVWYRSDPYMFTNVSPGQHRLMVELVNNDHSSLSPQVVREVQFQVAPANATAPQLTILGPDSGTQFSDANVQVTFQVAGMTVVPSTVPLAEAGKHPEVNRPGEGHLHFMLDLNPLVVWYTTDPYRLSNVPPGRHRLMVELVNNDHSSLSPPVVREIQFERVPKALPNTGEPAIDEVWPWAEIGVVGLLLTALGGGLRTAAYLRRRNQPPRRFT